MNDLMTSTQLKKKSHASFLKIYIQSGKFKLNMIPIPLFFAKWSVSFIVRLYRFSLRFQDNPDLSKHDVNEILHVCKSIAKEIRKHPPFDIIEVETKDTKIYIRTK